jgi:hypothetical protein
MGWRVEYMCHTGTQTGRSFGTISRFADGRRLLSEDDCQQVMLERLADNSELWLRQCDAIAPDGQVHPGILPTNKYYSRRSEVRGQPGGVDRCSNCGRFHWRTSKIAQHTCPLTTYKARILVTRGLPITDNLRLYPANTAEAAAEAAVRSWEDAYCDGQSNPPVMEVGVVTFREEVDVGSQRFKATPCNSWDWEIVPIVEPPKSINSTVKLVLPTATEVEHFRDVFGWLLRYYREGGLDWVTKDELVENLGRIAGSGDRVLATLDLALEIVTKQAQEEKP